MNTNLKTLAGMILMATVVAAQAQTEATSTAKKPATKKAHAAAAKKPSIESQIEALRQEMDSQRSQINNLQQQLTQKDAQLQQAQQSAAAAQSAAEQAQQAATAQQAQVTETQQNVASLQGAVGDLKTNTQSIVTTVQDQQAQVKKAIESPDTIHFKGITLSPTGSFVEFATVDRNRATASDIPTPFSSIPLEYSDAGQMSEFYMTGRQSRVALDAIGKVGNGTIRGYYEADWLGTGVTSNNNQSNSYVLRQRQIWAQAALNNGWSFTGGQMWSLATEYTRGLMNKSEAVPLTIDPNYNVGFVWARQPGFRVVKTFSPKFSIAVSAEQAQTLSPSCTGENFAGSASIACATNYIVGAPGTGSGLYNGGGAPGASSSAPLTGYTYNLAPDFIAKVAYDGYGHYELFGIARFFRDRIYPSTTSAAGAYNNTTVGGGIGGSALVPVFRHKLDLGIKGLYGDGTGRYGATQLSDVTVRPDGALSPLHSFSGMATIDAHATKRLDVYAYYGGDYVGRDYVTTSTGEVGYGIYTANNSKCYTQPVPGTGTGTGYSPTSATCGGSNKDTQEFTTGYWYNFYDGPAGRLRQSIQYSWVYRGIWSGIGGGANTSDNVLETSFRYYLP
ncbi:hypothetical protein [Silvibacterium sp.]|uniref:hypothetical protein n=1 Tax=Silvibacterium sp. TaxID=1964179 RepID=UPI0039E5EAEF